MAVVLLNTGLWIGEDAAFSAPGLVTSSKLAREENEFCKIKEHEVSLKYELDILGSPYLRQCHDR